MQKGNISKKERWLILGLVALAVLAGTAGFLYYKKAKEFTAISTELNQTKVRLDDTQGRYDSLKEERDYIYNNLLSEQAKNQLFENQIQSITGTVSRLDELSKTDKELLQKYSKVYFLNENYVPSDLINIPPDYLYEKDRTIQMHAKAFPYLQAMIVAAKADGVNLLVVSGYRSFGEQASLKNGYLVTYGSGANKFSADQGYSEHQLGTALDFTTKELGANFTNFAKSDAYTWLLNNAYKYGFILSYPEGNDYYQFEPWHWRFVGKSLANMLHEEKLNFYDLPQAKIDAYLINIFD